MSDNREVVAFINTRGLDISIEQGIFDEAGIEFVSGPWDSDADVIAFASDATCILTTTYQFSSALLAQLPKLRGIVRYGVGVDNVDLDAATSLGIVACNVVDYCVDEVSNHAFALLLALNRHLVLLDRIVREPDRVKAAAERAALGPVGPIRGETLGLVAFGPIAQSMAEKALAFGLRVIVHDPFIDPSVVETKVGTTPMSLNELLAQSDYISVHAPGGKETTSMIGAPEFALCKPSAIIVMTSRGGVVDEKALYEALVDGLIAAAGVDVWDPEPASPEKPLASLPNVIATPHFGYYSERAKDLLRERVAESAVDIINGYVPRSVVNRAVLDTANLVPSPNR